MNEINNFIDFSFLDESIKTDNIKKYTSKNPLIKIAVNKFIFSFFNMIELCNNKKLKRVLDIGIGEGILNHITHEKFKNIEIIGIDNSIDNLKIAKQIVESSLIRGDINNLPFNDDFFDLVISMEVLEHLAEPEIAIMSIKRVTKKFAILSVPNDYFFRLGNILRAKNIANLGNGPGHIQHFTEKSFVELIEKHFHVIYISKPSYLWIMCLLIKI